MVIILLRNVWGLRMNKKLIFFGGFLEMLARLIIFFTLLEILTFMLVSCILVWAFAAKEFPDLAEQISRVLYWMGFWIFMLIVSLVGCMIRVATRPGSKQ